MNLSTHSSATRTNFAILISVAILRSRPSFAMRYMLNLFAVPPDDAGVINIHDILTASSRTRSKSGTSHVKMYRFAILVKSLQTSPSRMNPVRKFMKISIVHNASVNQENLSIAVVKGMSKQIKNGVTVSAVAEVSAPLLPSAGMPAKTAKQGQWAPPLPTPLACSEARRGDRLR